MYHKRRENTLLLSNNSSW